MKKSLFAAVITGLITAVILCCISCNDSDGTKLVLFNSETGKVYREFSVSEGTEFSVEFVHSVNKSPVKDVFVIQDEKMIIDRTVYSAFGAGVQTEIEEGQKLEYDDDGNMIVSGFNIVFPQIKYILAEPSDHVLEINGEKISLRETCGVYSHICFELR